VEERETKQLYWVQGLSQDEIACLYKIGHPTISAAMKKYQPTA
jgi:DNA-binding CsgD family transcriptional regulator